MKEYIISLNFITSSSVKKKLISDQLNLKDDKIHCQKLENDMLWRIESSLDKESSIIEHIGCIVSMVPSDLSSDFGELIKEMYIDIGVFYDTLTCSVSLSGKCINLINKTFNNIDIEITCYPCED